MNLQFNYSTSMMLTQTSSTELISTVFLPGGSPTSPQFNITSSSSPSSILISTSSTPPQHLIPDSIKLNTPLYLQLLAPSNSLHINKIPNKPEPARYQSLQKSFINQPQIPQYTIWRQLKQFVCQVIHIYPHPITCKIIKHISLC